MRHFISRKSLHSQLVALSFACVAGMAGVSVAVSMAATAFTPEGQVFRLRLLVAVAITGTVTLGVLFVGINRLLRPLARLRDAMSAVSRGELEAAGNVVGSTARRPVADAFGLSKTFDRMLGQLQQARVDQERSAAAFLAARTRTVDRLLEFSQGIQAAGKPEQVLATLSHFLHADLGLSGMALLAVEPDAVPTTAVRSLLPGRFAPAATARPGEMDPATVPVPAAAVAPPLPRRRLARPVRHRHPPPPRPPTTPPTASRSPAAARSRPSPTCSCPPAATGTTGSNSSPRPTSTPPRARSSSLHLLAEAERTSMTDGLTGHVQPPVARLADDPRGRPGRAARPDACRWS